MTAKEEADRLWAKLGCPECGSPSLESYKLALKNAIEGIRNNGTDWIDVEEILDLIDEVKPLTKRR